MSRSSWAGVVVACLLVFVVATAQQLRTPVEPYRIAGRWDDRGSFAVATDWMTARIESVPGTVSTPILGDLNAITTRPGTDELWAVGSGGLIVTSADGGRTWSRRVAMYGAVRPMREMEESGTSLDEMLPQSNLNVRSVPAEDPGDAQISVEGGADPHADMLLRLLNQEMQTGYAPRAFHIDPSAAADPESSVPSTADFLAVAFATPDVGVCVGDSGALAVSFDGGGRWIGVPLEVRSRLQTASTWATSEWSTLLLVGGEDAQFSIETRPGDDRAGDELEIAGVAGRSTEIRFSLIAASTDPPIWRFAVRWQRTDADQWVGVASLGAEGDRAHRVGGADTEIIAAADAKRTDAANSSASSALGILVADAGASRLVVVPGSLEPATTTPLAATAREMIPRTLIGTIGGAWIVGGATDDGGTALLRVRISAGSGAVERVPAPRGAAVNGILLLDDGRGWCVGDLGMVLGTTDGGANWERLTPDWHAYLLRRHGETATTAMLADADRLERALDSSGAIMRIRWPAPWYFALVALLATILIGFVVPRALRASRITVHRSAEDCFLSDRPLRAGDPDPLGFGRLAAGLSRFLRNARTAPPVTLAIVGRWGSGKSSIMSLLKSDLERFGIRPVMFNAWHHQKEEHLLAALLAQIRADCVPRWWRPEGVIFRAKLFARRVHRHWVVAALLLTLLGGWVGYISVREVTFLGAIEATTDAASTLAHWVRGGDQASSPAGGAELGLGSAIAYFVGLVLSIFTVLHALRPFGMDPAALVASASGAARAHDLSAELSFRHRFANEFAEVTEALRPRTMTILIDDLDRCSPTTILEALEAINFLVSSGDCFVVLGIDDRVVEQAVAHHFREIADRIPVNEKDEPGATAESESTQTARASRYAREYLEKLIQVRIRVPDPSADKAAHVVQVAAEIPMTRENDRRGRVHALATQTVQVCRRRAPLLVTSTLIVVAAMIGIRMGSSLATSADAPRRPTPVAAAASPSEVPSSPVDSGETVRDARSPTASGPSGSPVDQAGAQSVVRAGLMRSTGRIVGTHAGGLVIAPEWIAALLFVVVVIWLFLMPPSAVVVDSDEFSAAMALWCPLLVRPGVTTPRRLKRFVNRVRFHAMMTREATRDETRLERLLAHLPGGRDGPNRGVDRGGDGSGAESRSVDDPTPRRIPDSLLVAWCARHERFGERGEMLSADDAIKEMIETASSTVEIKTVAPQIDAVWKALDAATVAAIRAVVDAGRLADAEGSARRPRDAPEATPSSAGPA